MAVAPAPLQLPKKNLISDVGLPIDISRKKMPMIVPAPSPGCVMEAALSQCVRSMRPMLHDLAQPLSILAGTVDLLMIESDPSSQQFQEVKNLSEQLQVIINKMETIRQLARQLNALVEN